MMLNRSIIARLFAAICLLLATSCPGWGADNIIRPLVGNEILGSRDVIGSATNGIIDPVPIFVYQPERSWISAHADGIKTTTYARTSAQTYIDVDGVLRTAPANVPAVGQYGVELDGARTNLIRYSEDFTEWTAYDATILSTTEPDPAGGNTASKIQLDAVDKSRINTTQIVGTSGNPYTMSIYLRSDSLVDVTIGTSASATAQQSTVSVTTTWKRYDITVTSDGDDYPSVINRPGTSVKTVYVWGAQYQAGTLATAYIPTNGAAATQTTSASDTSGNGLQVDLTQRMIDVFKGELIDWTTEWTYSYDSAYYSVDSSTKTITSTSGTNMLRKVYKSGVLVAGETYEITYTISGLSGGAFRVFFGATGNPATDNLPLHTSDGTFTAREIATGGTSLGVRFNTSAVGSVTINSMRHVRADGTINPGEGTLIQWVYLPYASSAITSSTTINVLTSNNAAASVIYITENGSGARAFNLRDGTNTASVTASATAGLYGIVSKFNTATGKMCIGYAVANSSAVTWGTEATYDGAFPIYSTDENLRWFYGGTLPLSIGNCALYDSILSDDEIIRAARKLQ